MRAQGHAVSRAHVRHLNPFPGNLGEVLGRFEHVLVPEMNLGQLAFILRGTYLVNVVSFSKVQGKPFSIHELVQKMKDTLEGRAS